MIDELIPYYQRELDFLKDSAGNFAETYPNLAKQLRLSRDVIDDPHVERLMQGVAFLNARLSHKIDDEFSEISDAMLETLHPHLIAPLPSFFVARLAPSPDLTKPMLVPRGTLIDADAGEGETCRYHVTRDTVVLPVRVARAVMAGDAYPRPAGAPADTKGVLHLELEATSPEADFSRIALDRLRLFLRGDQRKAHILLEQLGVNLLGMTVSCGAQDPAPAHLPPDALRNAGFDDAALLLPQSQPGLRPYAMLQEYFAYPQKHMFLELVGLGERTRRPTGVKLDLYFYFDRFSPELDRAIDPADFEINAAPVINLFQPDPDPVAVDHTLVEYRVSPGPEREYATEVHSVTDMKIVVDGVQIPVPPLYDVDHDGDPDALFYATTRRMSFGAGGGDDVYLSVADRAGKLLGNPHVQALPTVLAFNRDLPATLAAGGDGVRLEAVEAINGLARIEALTAATPTRRPYRQRGARWKLISQLSLNHLSFTGPEGVKALSEILALHDVVESSDNKSLRARLIAVAATPDVARTRVAGHMVMCSGTAVELLLRDKRLSGNGSYLLCEVLQRFLGTAASLNSFVRLKARLQHDGDVWKSWPPRVGDRELL